MKIRVKLLAIVVGLLVSFLIVAAAFLLIFNFIQQIERERGELTALLDGAKDFEISLGQVGLDPLEDSAQALGPATTRFKEDWNKLQDLSILPQINTTVRDSIDILKKQAGLLNSDLEAIPGALQELLTIARDTYKMAGPVTMTRFYEAPLSNTIDLNDIQQAKFKVVAFVTNLRVIQQTLLGTTRSLKKQFDVIDAEIQKITNFSLLITFSAAAAFMLLALLFAIVTARGISRSIGRIENGISQLRTGDLRVRLATKSRDEIGTLGRDLDEFLLELGRSIDQIKHSSQENHEIKDELFNSVDHTSQNADKIGSSTSSIGSQMQSLDSLVRESLDSLLAMKERIARFRITIEDENKQVETSVDHVNRMIGTIGALDKVADEDRTASIQLRSEAAQGREVFESAFDRIAEIDDSVGSIQEMVIVIQNIASQTNLLAMNAAIEAAHAGEFGKGFGVVADEIGKLAGASTDSSREIESTIQAIVAKIRAAAEVRDKMQTSFETIVDKIGNVSESIDKIQAAMSQLREDSQGVLGGMDTLSKGSSVLLDESRFIENSSHKNWEGVRTLGEISMQVVSSVTNIVRGLDDISVSVKDIATQAQKIERVGGSLESSVNRFQTFNGQIAAHKSPLN